MAWLLSEPVDGLSLFAEVDGIWLRGKDADLSDPRCLRSRAPKTRLGRLLPTLIPQLLDLGMAVVENSAVRIAHADFVDIEAQGIDAFEGVAPWAPFTLEIGSSGSLGGEGFKYYYRFYLGSQIVSLERIGCFVRRTTTIYRLDTQTFAMVGAIDSFNALPPEAKADPNALIRFATIKGLAEGVGAQLDRYLTRERVLVPSRIALDLIVEEAGRISFAPEIDGVSPETMRQAFFALDDVEAVYSLDHPEGGRVRVVLDETQREVLRRMQRVRHLSGADRMEVLRDPLVVFDGVAEAIFQPWLTLHGSTLQAMRQPGSAGKETVIGEAVLDLERLRQYRVILTNYETVTNYQHSFAQMKDHWSVVITDEAQEYKTPNTKISHALKGLAPGFRVACTGTPVETRLLDVWNLFDFLQPGQLLGSTAEFTRTYEAPLEKEGAAANGSIVLAQLKERLRFGRPDAFLLRREKTSLAGLPDKHEHELICQLSPEQREWHLDFVARAHAMGEGNHPLALIQHLMRLYQHPALVPRYEPVGVEEAIERCPKLAAVLKCLHSIRAKGEKALIFTRSLNMQQILASVIEAEFGIEVDIINGATSRRGDTKGGSRTRKNLISRFRESPGFNLLVLSPDVAGIGLTLVEANHVIHYGRWWNPAREEQATDRVYRIGQKRDVHVYYPIAKDPEGAFETFDEKLHRLIHCRQELAAEFLAPMPGEDDLGQELLSDILGTSNAPLEPGGPRTLSKDDVRRLSPDRFETLVAVLEEQQGAQVLVTPRAGDGGIDVIAKREGEIRLVQCKHTLWDASVDAEAVAEVICAFDGYRARWLKSLAKLSTLRPVLVTNGSFTARAKTEAKARDVQLVASTDLWRILDATPCTPAEIEAMEGRRLASMRDVRVAIERLIG